MIETAVAQGHTSAEYFHCPLPTSAPAPCPALACTKALSCSWLSNGSGHWGAKARGQSEGGREEKEARREIPWLPPFGISRVGCVSQSKVTAPIPGPSPTAVTIPDLGMVKSIHSPGYYTIPCVCSAACTCLCK